MSNVLTTKGRKTRRKANGHDVRNRLSISHTKRLTGKVDREAVAFHNTRQRHRVIYRYEWQTVNGKPVRKRVLVRILYKSPAE